MLFYLKLVLHMLVLPPACLLCLALAGLLLARRRPRLGHAAVVLALVLLWVLSMPIVGVRLVRAVGDSTPLDLSRAAAGGAVVILGGGARASAPEYGGAPSPEPVTLQRVAYGAYVARELKRPILVTGTATEAGAMQDALHRLFALDARWIDASARDTRENARHSATLLRAAGIDTVVLVTSSVHLRRATHEFEDAGLNVLPAPTDIEAATPDLLERAPLGLLPTIGGLERSNEALREWIGDRVRPALHALQRARTGR